MRRATTFCVLMADPYDFERSVTGQQLRLVLWRLYAESEQSRMVGDVMDELARRWPEYPVEVEHGGQMFSIQQKTGNGGATVAMITRMDT